MAAEAAEAACRASTAACSRPRLGLASERRPCNGYAPHINLMQSLKASDTAMGDVRVREEGDYLRKSSHPKEIVEGVDITRLEKEESRLFFEARKRKSQVVSAAGDGPVKSVDLSPAK